jgi:K(+)-stimulated pyrophosphate-energized sodium pump
MLYFCRRYGCESFCAVRAGLGRYSVYVVADSLGERTSGGEERMERIASYIARGALAFLKAEWRVLAVFAVIVAGF